MNACAAWGAGSGSMGGRSAGGGGSPGSTCPHGGTGREVPCYPGCAGARSRGDGAPAPLLFDLDVPAVNDDAVDRNPAGRRETHRAPRDEIELRAVPGAHHRGPAHRSL